MLAGATSHMGDSRGTTARPVPVGSAQDSGGQAGAAPERDDFVGAAVCGECHAERYAEWRASTHGQAGGQPGPGTVIAPFDGTPIRFADATVLPNVTADGVYRFTIRRQGRPEVSYDVDGVIGRGHMVGGGTQGFVTRLADGTMRFLPFDFSRSEGAWFCNTGRAAGWWTSGEERSRVRPDRGWVLVTEDLRLAECGDWPPVRVLGADLRFANCQDCHGSQITLSLDTASAAYRTELTSLDVNCESCHGPGRLHVQRARSGALSGADGPGLAALGIRSEDESLETCFQCHALKRALKTGYLPGASFGEYYSLLLPGVGDEPYHSDGRIRTFGYQLNHRESACYLDGAMTCVDCHDPHGQGYRDVAGAPVPDRFDDGQCTDCHASKGAGVDAHTGHPPASEGSRCVACHMPYLQQPELGSQVRYARSDHTIPVPRPGFDDGMGVPNACGRCHEDRSPAELATWTRRLWGTLKPQDAVESALIAAEAGEHASPEDEALALLRPGDRNAMALVRGLNRLLESYFTPDMPALDGRVETALRALSSHPDIDVRAVALAALHMARGSDPDTRTYLTERVNSMGEDLEPVLRRWLASLRFVAEARRRSGDPVTALEIVRKGLEIAPTDAGVLLDMGVLFDGVGDRQAAFEYTQRSLQADPDQPVAWVNLGQLFEAAGDLDRGRESYERALTLYQGEALAHLNLGNLDLRAGQYEAAVERYRSAVAADPSLTGAWFNLAAAYLHLERPDAAAEALRAVLEFDPSDQEAQALLDRVEGRTP